MRVINAELSSVNEGLWEVNEQLRSELQIEHDSAQRERERERERERGCASIGVNFPNGCSTLADTPDFLWLLLRPTSSIRP
jgi:hypothetical protein